MSNQDEYDRAYNHHAELIQRSNPSPEDLVDIASDLAARLEMVAVALPQSLIAAIAVDFAKEMAETEGEANESDGGNSEPTTDEPASEPAEPAADSASD